MKKQNKKLIIALTGHPSSGKGEVAKYLGEKYGAELLKFSTVLRDELNRLYLPAARKNFIIMSKCLRQNFGQDILAKVISENIKKSLVKIIIVDGTRREADLKYIKKFKKFHLVNIHADPKIRYQRQMLRREKPDDAKKTFKQFLKEQKSVSDKDVDILIKKADITLDNNGTMDQLHQQIDALMKKVVK